MDDNFLELIDYDDFLLSDCDYLDISEENLIYKRENSFTIAHFNIHSIPSKYDDFLQLLKLLDEKNLSPDIIMLCETFLSEKNHSRFHFQGYNMVNAYRVNKKRGGVSLLIKLGINYVERPDLSLFEEGKFESIFLEIQQNKSRNIVIGEVYRVPGTNETEFIEKYENIITRIKEENKSLIIGTDQNLDYLKINLHRNTMKFFEANLTNGIMPTIYKPTRVTTNTASLIDNIYVDCSLFQNIKSFIVKSDISDHYLCLACMNGSLMSNKTCETSITRKITDDVLRKMNASLCNRNWNMLDNMDVNESSEMLINEIKVVMDFYAPERVKNINFKKIQSQPWFTQGLTKSSRKCLKMFNKVSKKPKDSPEFQNYRIYRNMYNKIRRKAKIAYYNDLLQEHRKNTKKVWKILNTLTGKLKNRQVLSDEITVNGAIANDAEAISNAFAKFYSQVGKVLSDKIKEKGNIDDPMIYMKNRISYNCFFYPTSHEEIEKIITWLKVKDSSGCDQISNRILKKICPGIIKALEIICNKSLQQGTFPNNMKTAIVTPLYKGNEKTEIINYRPISLLPTISKILEKLVHTRITKFLLKHKVFFEGQYGFRKNRSTTDAILDLTGNVLENMNRGHYTMCLFLDMSKAFDSLNLDTILKKLEFYGIRGITLSWFKSYLTDRQIKVNFMKQISKPYKVTYGTPQGSVLGPLIYIILANDLIKCLKVCSAITYADDTTVYASGNNLKFLYKKVNSDIQNLNGWFRSNSLTLNIDKTKYMIFRPKRKDIKYNGLLKLGNNKIDRVQHIKFLGVHIDEFLDWDFHIKQVLVKMTAGNYSLNMIKNILPQSLKRLVYFANVQSHMCYALSAWGSMIKSKDRKKLQVQQNKAIRAICKLERRDRLSDHYRNLNILKIEDLIQLELLKISHKYIYGNLPVRLGNLFNLSHHTHHTRTRNYLRAAHHTIEKYNVSFLGKSPHLWLHLVDELKNKSKIQLFTKHYCYYMIRNY